MNANTGRVRWTQDSLLKALELVQNGTNIRRAAQLTNVPSSTLQTRLKTMNFKTPQLGRNPIFSKQQEDDLVTYVRFFSKIFYGCTGMQIRKVAYEYAEMYQIPHLFNKNLKMAGKDWLHCFLRRNGICLRKTENNCVYKEITANEDMKMFYRLLKDLMTTHSYLSRNIYYLFIFTYLQDPKKIDHENGHKRTTSLSDVNISAVCATNPLGTYISPMFIYPHQDTYENVEFTGLHKFAKKGWITENIFLDWLKHFSDVANNGEPILLILDNHSNYMSLLAFDFCEKNNISLLSVPPYCSTIVHPLDPLFVELLKLEYRQEYKAFVKSLAGEMISCYHAKIFLKAFERITSTSRADVGFAEAGIFPLNEHCGEELENSIIDPLIDSIKNEPEEIIASEEYFCKNEIITEEY